MTKRVGERMEVRRGEDGDWYVRHVAANNEPLNISEGYESVSGAKHAARRRNLPVYVERAPGEWVHDPASPEPVAPEDEKSLTFEEFEALGNP